MIPLRAEVVAASLSGPSVVRLNRARGLRRETRHDAYFIEIENASARYHHALGDILVGGLDPLACDGDVLLVLPAQRMAHRIIRANSRHNTLVVTERCDQLCTMCSQPPKSKHFDLFAQLETAALLAPDGAQLCISGGEPTLYKRQLFSLLSHVLAERHDLQFHVLSNGQHFEGADADALRAFGDRVLWGIPLYSPLAEQHDGIVGKPGAFDRLMQSMGVLVRSGACIELRTVVIAANAAALPLLATIICARLPFITVWAIMQLENIGYARKSWRELFFDSSRDFTTLGRALDICKAHGMDARLYNFPLCTVPPAYRSVAPATISDWKQKFLEGCRDCAMRSDCCGFFEWYPENAGFGRVGL